MTSNPGKKNIGRIVADANVILSAVIGKAALRVFTRSNLEIVSTTGTLVEVHKYIPMMSETYGIAPEILEGQLRLLAIKEYDAGEFKKYLSKAAHLIGKRDPDDIHLLALVLALNIPLWTNDKDFEIPGLECYTTAKLLKILGL